MPWQSVPDQCVPDFLDFMSPKREFMNAILSRVFWEGIHERNIESSFLRGNSWTQYWVEFSGQRLESSETRVEVGFSAFVFPFYKMVFTNNFDSTRVFCQKAVQEFHLCSVYSVPVVTSIGWNFPLTMCPWQSSPDPEDRRTAPSVHSAYGCAIMMHAPRRRDVRRPTGFNTFAGGGGGDPLEEETVNSEEENS